MTLPSLEEIRGLLDADEAAPDGALDPAGWGEHWGISKSSAWGMLKRLVEDGHWERVEVRRRDVRGRFYPHAYYRPRS